MRIRSWQVVGWVGLISFGAVAGPCAALHPLGRNPNGAQAHPSTQICTAAVRDGPPATRSGAPMREDSLGSGAVDDDIGSDAASTRGEGGRSWQSLLPGAFSL